MVENRYPQHKLFAPLDQAHSTALHKWGRVDMGKKSH